jgi:hypothetical protein
MNKGKQWKEVECVKELWRERNGKKAVPQETNREVNCMVGSKEWKGGCGKEITNNKVMNKVRREYQNMNLRKEKWINCTKKDRKKHI